MPNFSIFCPSGQKKSLRVGSESTLVGGGLASYLLQVKSKLGSGPITAVNCNEPRVDTLNMLYNTSSIKETANSIFRLQSESENFDLGQGIINKEAKNGTR